MAANSLASRLFVAAAMWTLAVLPIAAAVLVSLYRDAVERSFDARLNQYLEYLIVVSSPEQGVTLAEPANLGEPLFSLPFSGWYWQIKPLDGGWSLYKSESLVTERLRLPSELGIDSDGQMRRAYAEGPDDQFLRILEREITLSDGDDTRRFSYAIAGDGDEIHQEISAFTAMLITALSLLGAGLLLATFFQVRYGLRPLRDIGRRLAAIRSGDARELEGELPQEIRPLQQELNALIRSNQEIIDRARTHVGNLAHALKTPLSVITNEARSVEGPRGTKIVEQAELMRAQVSHQLDRARVAARLALVGDVTQVAPVVRSIVHALEHIYSERALSYGVDCPADARFQGEKQDFEEMVGNLLDNACKWAASTVAVTVDTGGAAIDGSGRMLTVLVDDNGPGLSEQQREAVVQRGRRLDESKPGAGLGLSIVADLSHLYHGSFRLEKSPQGGVRARLVLPAA